MIYLDNNSTTAVHPEVRDAMLPFLEEQFGNPSSPYTLGKMAGQALEEARAQVAELMGASSPREVVFTSCATESNYAAFHSATQLAPDRRHLLISAIEHSSIIHLADRFEAGGYQVTRLPVDPHGRVDPDDFAAALRPDTALASVMWANNETGVLQPVEQLAELAHARGVPFHTDAVQAAGKIPLQLAQHPIALASFSGHKFHAPKGVGALYIRRGLRYQALLEGSQEETRRAGTQNMASITGMGRAAHIAQRTLKETGKHLAALRQSLEDGLLRLVPDARALGAEAPRLPNTSNILLPGIPAEALLLLLDQRRIYVSTGSACTTGSTGPSHVLKALGLTDQQAKSCLRFSLSKFNDSAQIDEFLKIFPDTLQQVRFLHGV